MYVFDVYTAFIPTVLSDQIKRTIHVMLPICASKADSSGNTTDCYLWQQ